MVHNIAQITARYTSEMYQCGRTGQNRTEQNLHEFKTIVRLLQDSNNFLFSLSNQTKIVSRETTLTSQSSLSYTILFQTSLLILQKNSGTIISIEASLQAREWF